ncbi:TfoX/Sxy family DNA transformation protein [Paracoccus sp. (in: a-proteobacteria)]|uniref:TfoX/Sxy family DNA transformation protein n=1 Tax=Paracoccus sp. TaxID=267 RepID=UPI0026DF500F|nr:TfoX/Sxy family DNA transformation protein [Paracoccus sp. (in: a-proteobacteria)]MDO5647562.1 TfoX/Sxy family DNA transformation protein [Paracoccus sp. (in: a-proteobacteria)]
MTDSDLTQINLIGPATARALIAAGVPDAASLRTVGAHDAYHAMLVSGTRPHFIWYQVLHMALQDRPWNDVRGAERAELRARFDALVAATRAPRSDIETALNDIGLLPPSGDENDA